MVVVSNKSEATTYDDIIVEFKMAADELLVLHMAVVVGSHSLWGLEIKFPMTIQTLNAIDANVPTTAPYNATAIQNRINILLILLLLIIIKLQFIRTE